jgi:tetratricopeptide (TPR) repeat protein
MPDFRSVRLPRPSRQTIVVGVAVVLLALLLGVGGWYWQASQERQATGLYATALARVQQSRAAQSAPESRAAAIKDLEAALQSYPSASSAPQAAYELGGLKYQDRQYAAARSAYELALARGSQGTVRSLARLGVAYSWEAERDFPKAVTAYQTLVGDLRPADPLFEEALAGLGRVQELAGRKDDAVQTYRRFVKERPKSPRADDVKARLSSLGATP